MAKAIKEKMAKKDSHSHHHKMAKHHHAEMEKHIDHLHKLAKHAHHGAAHKQTKADKKHEHAGMETYERGPVKHHHKEK